MNTQEFEHGILYQGNCIEIMPKLPAQNVDAILTDLPYGTTACSWDVVIPFELMWEAVKHVLKPNGAFVTTASQPFTSLLVCSNIKAFSYCWVFNKCFSGSFVQASRMPMRIHEDICVFSMNNKTPQYFPQKTLRSSPVTSGGNNQGKKAVPILGGKVSQWRKKTYFDKFPESIVTFQRETGLHPTQKPVALYKYLVQTYTNPGDTVLDMCMGSGTTMIACMDLAREWIGIEKDPEIFETACERIHAHNQQLPMFPPPLEKRNTDAKQLNLV